MHRSLVPRVSLLRARRTAAVCLAGACTTANVLCCAIAQSTEPTRAADHFERKVRPLLIEKCVDCHGPDSQEGELRLDSAEGLFRGGQSGPVVEQGNVERSRLIHLVRGSGELQMPPDDRLSPDEIAALEQWVQEGAIWPGYDPAQSLPSGTPPNSVDAAFTDEQRAFWAFQPVRDPVLPAVADGGWPTSPIDHFMLARLEAAGLKPANRADKRTLLRRVTYGLIGMPPTPEEIAAFLADDSHDALATVVERLLASPHYGERWGQHWLDVVRYAESAGHDGNNAYIHAWRYRDYVIRSLNSDKPYDQFIVEQLAGDLLPKTGAPQQDFDQLVATAFLQVGPKPVVMRDKRQMLLDIADEQLHTTGVALLGLTLGCARCHDHKFDPIPTADYYSLAGIFTSTHVMADAAPDSMWLEQKTTAPDGAPAVLMRVEDLKDPKNLQVHLRGNYRTLGAEAPRRFLQIIAGAGHPPLDTSGSGRLELAKWIASPGNPLTARVMVNRIWQHHFGRGLVTTGDNFGELGARPTHPELLDWLATRFVESGWSIKAMHRLLIRSSAYQQACAPNPDALRVDPENRLCWRMPRRRLSAEELRDTILAVSGSLDRTMGGTLFTEGYQPGDESRELYVVDISDKDPFPPFEYPRRSIYLPVLRNARPEMLKLFDAANEHASTSSRGETTVAPQALFLLNSAFVREQAEALALSILDHQGVSGEPFYHRQDAAIEQLFHLALSRPPTSDEHRQYGDFITAYQQRWSTVAAGKESSAAEAEHLYARTIRRLPGLIAYHQLEAVEFNGADQRLLLEMPRMPQNASGAMEALSIELWIRPGDVRTATIACCDGPGDRLWRVGIAAAAGGSNTENRLFHEFYPAKAGGRRIAPENTPAIPVDQWSHIVVTYGGGERRLYLNGRLVDQLSAESMLRPLHVPLTLGARGDGTEWYRGELNHVSLYDRVLDDKQVAQHYRLFRRHHWPAEDLARLYAWRAACQALFCLNEFVYVD